ncbi:MAG: cell division protein FtsZ [Caulobacteraceae bacterium]
MTFKVFAPQERELKPRIVVFGVGGAGGNAVNNMIEAGLEGVEFVVANTDSQQLAFSKTERRIQLGVNVTQGLGAGAHPEVGMTAAEESAPEIGENLDGAHMVFITAGMGGGTGTGAGPIIAKCARERGILTVGVVTKPFHFEGRHRMRLAEAGISELQRYVDTLIVIPNQNLFRVANERTTFSEAFAMADQVLHSGVRSITDLMVLPGLINLDFADVRTVMTEMGKAMMGTGEASGEGRALMAAENAIQNPLLDEVSLKGAKAVLVNITGGLDMTLLEVDEAANAISGQVDPEANIIFGAAFDASLKGVVRVSVVATGMDGAAISLIEPQFHRRPEKIEPVAMSAPAPELRPAISEPRFEPQVEPAAEPVPIAASAEAESAAQVLEPGMFEPLRAAGYTLTEAVEAAGESQPDLALEAPAAAPTVVRIIDPAVGGEEEDEEPLFGPAHYADGRRRKGGFLSMFGRPKRAFTSGSPQLRTTQQAAPESGEEIEPEDGEDLEIPSFLRRLAN